MNRGPVPIRLVVFDWAGTLVDHGSRAPVVALIEAFDAEGLAIDEATARQPMGLRKRDHVQAILEMPAVVARLPADLAALPLPARVDRVYDRFNHRLLQTLPAYATPIGGAIETLAALRERGIAVASGSGYTRAMMDVIEPLAHAAGLDPGPTVCADEVPQGRPAPWALFRLAERFGVWPMQSVLKVGDTAADIAEGRNAGARTVGITASGNEVGLSATAWTALPAPEREAAIAQAQRRLHGADAWLLSVADLPRWLDAN